METITVLNKTFQLSIGSDKITERVLYIANEINHDLKNKDVVFIGILNGSFMFVSDLMKNVNLQCSISFMKLSSYDGVESSGQVMKLIGLEEDLTDKTVIIVEDIVETGNSLHTAIRLIKELNPLEFKIASLLFKPDAYKYNYNIDYVGFLIPNDFIVGYGLDYKGYGRNLNDIFTIIDT